METMKLENRPSLTWIKVINAKRLTIDRFVYWIIFHIIELKTFAWNVMNKLPNSDKTSLDQNYCCQHFSCFLLLVIAEISKKRN